MLDVKDEVLEDEARYQIVDNDGNILFNGIRIEMVTPVIQEGTPINRKLFRSIESGNDLVQMYNKPTYTEVNIESSDNFLDGTWETVSENAEYKSGNKKITIEGASLISEGSFANALDNSTATNVVLETGDFYINIDAGTLVKGTISLLGITGNPSYNKMSLYGSINGINWDTIALDVSINRNGGDIVTTAINCDSYYRYYKLHIHTGTLTTTITGISITSSHYTVGTDYNIFELDNIITNYEKFQRVLIAVPSSYVSNGLLNYLNINNLGLKLIDGELTADKMYELTYDGTMFIAKEV